MKCDELKAVYMDKDGDYVENPHGAIYMKDEVDEAIVELKAEHHKERDEYISMVYRREQTIKELKADNERLTRELEHVKNGDCINTCDVLEKYGKELCATRRALWLARAYRAGHCASVFYFVPSEYLNTPLNIYGYANKDIGMERMLKPRRWMKIWQKVERLCRAKAEEYK